MLDDSLAQANLRNWQDFLYSSSNVLSETHEHLSKLYSQHDSTSNRVYCPNYRWTSVDPSLQRRRDNPAYFYYQCSCSDQDCASSKRIFSSLLESVNKTRQHGHHVSRSLHAAISLIESIRGIAEAEGVSKLTELAFIFIPLSFSASFFSMPIDVSPFKQASGKKFSADTISSGNLDFNCGFGWHSQGS